MNFNHKVLIYYSVTSIIKSTDVNFFLQINLYGTVHEVHLYLESVPSSELGLPHPLSPPRVRLSPATKGEGGRDTLACG